MKKLWIIGGIVVLLFGALIGLNWVSNKDKLSDYNPYDKENLDQATIDLLDDKNYQSIILPAALQEKIASGEPTVAYMFSPVCAYCKNFTPKLMPIAEEYDVEVNQLNVYEYQNEWNTYAITATPTLIFFNEGIEVTRLVGDYDKDAIHAFFKAAGYTTN